MKSIEKKVIKPISTGEQLEEEGYQYLWGNKRGKVIFGKGFDRRVYQRLIGKTERYKFIGRYQSKRKNIE